MDKRITELFSAKAQWMVGECERCYGDGDIQHDCFCCETGSCASILPCPTCAPLRQIAELCWSNFELNEKGEPNVIIEQQETNPTYTIPQLREYMKTLEVWEEFIKHVRWTLTYICEHVAAENDIYLHGDKTSMIADILTTPELMKQSIISFLEAHNEKV